jgi:hypothetical protein
MNPLLLVLLLVLVLGFAGFFEVEDENEKEDEADFGCKLALMGVRGERGSDAALASIVACYRCSPFTCSLIKPKNV